MLAESPKLLLTQTLVQPLLLSSVTECPADRAVSSQAGETLHGVLGFYYRTMTFYLSVWKSDIITSQMLNKGINHESYR